MAIGAIELEQVDLALSACTHPHVTTEGGDSDISWCNVCGAIMTSAGWLQPHWRDLLTKLVKSQLSSRPAETRSSQDFALRAFSFMLIGTTVLARRKVAKDALRGALVELLCNAEFWRRLDSKPICAICGLDMPECRCVVEFNEGYFPKTVHSD